MDELQTDISRLEGSLQELSARRQALYNQMRRASDDRLDALRAERDEVSRQIASVRKDLKAAKAVEAGSLHIQETLDQMVDHERRLRASERKPTEKGYAR